jgi:hypothetical protein
MATKTSKRFVWLWALVIALGSAQAWAQTVPYTEDFEGDTSPWSLHGLWAVDGSPSAMPGGAANAGAKSLNFNDGVDYDGLQRAACQSPSLRAPNLVDHTLTFWCNYQTETTGTRYDQRSVIVRVNGNQVINQQLSGLSSAPAGARCGAMGAWHQHEMSIPYPVGYRSFFITLEFVFDSVDDFYNSFPGWFIDDISVEPITPTTAAVFDTLSRATRNFQQYTSRLEVDANRDAVVYQSSPTARYAPIQGRVTDAEWQALTNAISAANLASIPDNIPDPNVYIVAPTTFALDVISQTPANDNTISGSLGVYGQWSAQLSPVMDAIAAIERRLLTGAGGSGDDHGDDHGSATAYVPGHRQRAGHRHLPATAVHLHLRDDRGQRHGHRDLALRERRHDAPGVERRRRRRPRLEDHPHGERGQHLLREGASLQLHRHRRLHVGGKLDFSSERRGRPRELPRRGHPAHRGRPAHGRQHQPGG